MLPTTRKLTAMKTRIILNACMLAGLAAATTATAQAQAKPQMRPPATHESLSNTLRQAQAINPLNNFKAVEGEDKTEVYKPESLIGSSDVISFNGLTTLVPKRAILAMPDSVKSRVGSHQQGNRVVQFQEFLQANRGWVTAVEVTRAQAQGREKLADSLVERIGKSTSMMVATFNGGPISVLPPRDPEPEADASGTAQSQQP